MNDDQWKEAREMAKHSDSFTIPKDIKWTVEDFKDLYFTMVDFKKRFFERRKKTMMRAKMKVTEVDSFEKGVEPKTFESLKFSAVCKSDGYPADGSDENNTFAKWTPSAELKMTITNPALFGKFTVGQEFYVDFTPTVLHNANLLITEDTQSFREK